MSRCALGEKKLRRLEALTGCKVTAAFVRGGYPHFWAHTIFADGPSQMVNYQTGAMDPPREELERRRLAMLRRVADVPEREHSAP